MLISTVMNALAFLQVSNALTGYGQSVIGRIKPSLKPSARAIFTASFEMQELIP